MDTLYTTIETGTDDNGVEWEKRQATAPRTFEEAIVDKNKVSLSQKITDILNKINDLDGGEYDTLLAEIEALKQEVDDLDLEQWNYIVPVGKDIIFPSVDGEHSKRALFGRDGDNNLLLMNNNTTFIGLDADGNVRMPRQLNMGSNIHFPYDHGIYFGQSLLADSYLFYTDLSKRLYTSYRTPEGGLDALVEFTPSSVNVFKQLYLLGRIGIGQVGYLSGSSEWGAIMADTVIGLCMGSKNAPLLGGIQFNNSDDIYSHFHKILEEKETGSLSFINGNKPGGWTQSAYVDTQSIWHFNKPISAPNMASIASILAAEQEITEMDLQNIEAQRTITEQELNNIEVQQELTEINLLLLEKESA